VIAHSDGCYFFTPEGRKLADFTSGVLVANLGHNPTRWWQRVFDYMGLGRTNAEAVGEFYDAAPLTSYNATTVVEVQATERLLANLRAQPGGERLEKVLWAASGSEAIQKALWASLAFKPESDIILATRHGFHGKKGLAGAVTGTEDDKDRDPRVRFVSFPRSECASVQRRREPINLTPYQQELERFAIEFGSRLNCLITEPYLGGGGSFHPQPEYLQLLEQFCRDHEMVFILDEVQSNFGRTGSMYAYTSYGVEPDLVVLGKGMANGIPIDAAVGRADILDVLKYGEGSDTWSGHPLGAAAVLATLDEFEQTDEFEQSTILKQAAELSQVIEEELCRLAELDAIAAVRGEGTVWGIECAAVGSLSADETATRIVRECYLGDEAGNAIHLLGPLAGKVIRVAPPMVMPVDEARKYLRCIYEIIHRCDWQHHSSVSHASRA
jgi:4-aminobutyrate aminotransferase-like enzyme